MSKKVSKTTLTQNKLRKIQGQSLGLAYMECKECEKRISIAEDARPGGYCIGCKTEKVMTDNW